MKRRRESENNVNETSLNAPKSRESSTPLGSVTHGSLRFLRGASNVTVHTDPSTADLYRARFEGPLPGVRIEGGTLAVEYPWTLHPFDWRKRGADVVLNGSIPWEIGFSGGLSRLDADLSGLRLDSFSASGGVSRVELLLAEPSGKVSIRFDGGASHVTIRRPKGVAACVLVGVEPASWRSTTSTSAPSPVRRGWRALTTPAPLTGTRSPSPAAPAT
jgi:hypothetical protein